MALRFVFLLLAAGVAASAAPAPAQSPELRVMHARVVQLYATGTTRKPLSWRGRRLSSA